MTRQAEGNPGAIGALSGNSGSGSASLIGYEYQIDVSVWLALDLVLVTRLANSLVLEPISEEDLEATLVDSEPGRLVSRVPMPEYTLVVQAKYRGGDAWTPKSIRSLLLHGSDHRDSAAKRLKDTNCRYLLVTNAGVNGDARHLVCRNAGVWPEATAMPRIISDAVEHEISGRVAVIANQDQERLRGDINRILVEFCRIPMPLIDACYLKFREGARARIASAGSGQWTRADLEQIVHLHQGFLARSSELEHYVRPTNWSYLRTRMAERSAAIIIGQSGTGKTLATQALYDELANEIPGLSRVLIRKGPSELRDDMTQPPVLYDIEDPWGRFDFDPNSRPWNDQLSTFLAAARPGRMIIATSRKDVAQASGALQSVEPWVVALESENYGPRERRLLYGHRLKSLPRDLKAVAEVHEKSVLDKLQTPLEIQKFFDAIRTQDTAGLEKPEHFITAAVNRAHQNSIEQTVMEQIEGRGDLNAVAILWGMLKVNERLMRPHLRDLEEGLADAYGIDCRVSPLIDFFVAARNFRQADDGALSYYHPRVEAGITRTLKANRIRARLVLQQLINFLATSPVLDEQKGVSTAAEIYAVASDTFSPMPCVQAVNAFDAWIETKLAQSTKELGRYIEMSTKVGSLASNGAEIARFIMHRPDNTFGNMDIWGCPEMSEAWYTARMQDPGTKPLLESFIRYVLPTDRAYYPASFAETLIRISPGLEQAFLASALNMVGFGSMSSEQAVVTGALRDLDGFEAVVDAAVQVLQQTPEAKEALAEILLDIENSVYSEEYAEHLQDDDTGHTAWDFLKAYVEAVRSQRSWKELQQHRHIEHLRKHWLSSLASEANEERLDKVEFEDAFRIGYETADEEFLWAALLSSWEPQYTQRLVRRLRSGVMDPDVNHAVLRCVLAHCPEHFVDVVTELLEQGAYRRVVEISCELAALHKYRSDARRASGAEAAAMQLPAPYNEIFLAKTYLLNKACPLISSEALRLLAAIHEPGAQIRELRLEVDNCADAPIVGDISWALASDDSQIAALGIDSAIRHGLVDIVNASIGHKFASVVSRALTALSASMQAPLPKNLLSLSEHRASPVRRALSEALLAKPHAEHVQPLLLLASDRWSRYSSYGHDVQRVFPIARLAMRALIQLSPLEEAQNEVLYAIATDNSDPAVRDAIFIMLADSSQLMEGRLLDEATGTGPQNIRRSAAVALLNAYEHIDQRIVERITLDTLRTCTATVASRLVLLLSLRAAIDTIVDVAKELAVNADRKALALLIVWGLAARDHAAAEQVAQMLPADHEAVARALAGDVSEVDDAMIAELGSISVCKAVLECMAYKGLRDDTSD